MKNEKMKCKLCNVSIINGIGYQTKNGIICEACCNDLKCIAIKDGKYLVDMEFIVTFIDGKTVYL